MRRENFAARPVSPACARCVVCGRTVDGRHIRDKESESRRDDPPSLFEDRLALQNDLHGIVRTCARRTLLARNVLRFAKRVSEWLDAGLQAVGDRVPLHDGRVLRERASLYRPATWCPGFPQRERCLWPWGSHGSRSSWSDRVQPARRGLGILGPIPRRFDRPVERGMRRAPGPAARRAVSAAPPHCGRKSHRRLARGATGMTVTDVRLGRSRH